MDDFSELMSRQAKLMEVWKERCVRGEQYSVGPILSKRGNLAVPVYSLRTGERLEDLMMARGETRATRCWGPGSDQKEVL